ncbi:MAG: hypothetical protein ACRESK_04055, partial [Gammaproteobacteria bacterium]
SPVQAGAPVYALRVNPGVFVHYLHTRIHEENSMDAVLEKIRGAGRGPALVILRTSLVEDIPHQVPHEILYTTHDKKNKTITLVMVNPAP